MPEVQIHFHRRSTDPHGNLIADVSNFVFYDDASWEKKAKMNTKLNLSMSFDANSIHSLLQSFFNFAGGPARFNVLISKHGSVDYHGTIKKGAAGADDLASVAARAALPAHNPDRGFPTRLTVGGEDYDLLEIGVDIGLYRGAGPAAPIRGFDNSDCNLEIKFGKTGTPDSRMIVNIHFEHDSTKHDITRGVRTLNSLVSQLFRAAEIAEMNLAKTIDVDNFYRHEYYVPNKSVAYYMIVHGQRYLKDAIASLKHVTERDAAVAARDTAIIERDAAVAAREIALAEKATAITERDAALAEKAIAIIERDAAVAAREAASAAKSSGGTGHLLASGGLFSAEAAFAPATPAGGGETTTPSAVRAPV